MNGHYGHYKENVCFGKSFKKEDKIVEKRRRLKYIDLCSIRFHIYILDFNRMYGMLQMDRNVRYIDG